MMTVAEESIIVTRSKSSSNSSLIDITLTHVNGQRTRTQTNGLSRLSVIE